MADAVRKLSDTLMRLEAGDVATTRSPQLTQREAHYFVSDDADADDADALTPPSAFANSLPFQYKGDVFAQRGHYADAALYMSRLPPTRKAAALRPKAGASSKLPVKLAPMAPPAEREAQQRSSEKVQGSGKKRQYVLAVEAMAANPALHANLLRDSVVPNVVGLCRTKDAATLASCVATLCHLSCDVAGRQAILGHNTLTVLLHVAATAPPDKLVVAHALATLANLTIEDACESAFVKDKALDSIVQSRKSGAAALADAMASFALFNLSCPTYAYPRVEDVIRALVDFAKDARERELLGRALYNFACTKTNQLKLVESPETTSLLRTLITRANTESVRRNALMALWHLSDNAHCRRAVVRADCVRALVRELECLTDDAQIEVALLTLLNLSAESVARECMGGAQALDALDQLSQRVVSHATELQLLIYELIAVILSDPSAIATVSESFLRFLLSFVHSHESERSRMSCYVLFSLTCVLSWSDQETPSSASSGVIVRDASTGALALASSATPSLDELLDEPQHLALIYRHVAHAGFASHSSELYLQVLLLYNLSFRYSKVDVATLAAPWLTALARTSSEERALSLLCGIFFNLCQEYAVHAVFSHASSDGSSSLHVLERFARFCDDDAKCMSLEVVCIVLDARYLPQAELVALAVAMFPVLAEICATGGAAIRASCAACFARFAMLDACRVPMVQSGLVASLAILAHEDDPQTLRLCVHAYSYLCRSASVCATLIQSGIIKALTYLAAAPEEAVRRACAMTLCNISTCEEHIDALVQGGALRALLVISCVKSNDPETRRICMKSVMNLLRHSNNIAQLCRDGLLWAFGLFVNGMEPKDFDILADTFCALTLYPATRSGTTKAPTLARMLEILDAPMTESATLVTKCKVLKGIANLLSEAPSASLLLSVGVLPHLARVVDNASRDDEVKALVAHIFVLLFQSASASDAVEFADPAALLTVAEIMKGEREDCSRCCCLLLLRLSTHEETRSALAHAHALAALPSLFLHASKDSQTNLVRCLYNLSCDAELLPAIAAADVLSHVAMATHSHAYALEIAKLSAGILRNLSCASACHASLLAETAMAMLRDLFDVDDVQCREDVGICVCNLFLGQYSNTHALLALALLPLVLALCSHADSAHRALSSAVLRKLALAPGNTEMLIDGGAIGPLALLLQHPSASLYVKKNCVAAFCLLSQRSDVPRILGSVGIISSVLALLDDHAAWSQDRLFETMCIDLLSALAEFARSDDPREGRIASILYELMDTDEGDRVRASSSSAASAPSETWQNDRSFLNREPMAGGQLPALTLSTMHAVAPSQLPVLPATLFPLQVRGYSVELNLVASHVDTHTIEPLIPDFWALLESSEASGDSAPSSKQTRTQQQQRRRRRSAYTSVAFVPPEMYEKIRTPFTPSVLEAQWHSKTLIPAAGMPPMTPSKKVPPLLHHHHRRGTTDGSSAPLSSSVD